MTDPTRDADGDRDVARDSDTNRDRDTDRPTDDPRAPGQGRTPASHAIEPAAPEEFGLVQVWWGDGKGKTTAALGMGFRAAGHGYRVHVLQFMKGGAASVEPVRGEYNAIDATPGISYENLGHYGWHALNDGSDDRDHEREARAGLDRARELVAAAGEADLSAPLPLDGPADDGMYLLVLDEILYAANRGLLDPGEVVSLVEAKPDALELVLTGGHQRPGYVIEHADLVSNVRGEVHPIDAGQRARKGTEY